MAWYRRGHRDLPWRGTRDPYAIWLSETMLQQTRAAAAAPYYLKFLAMFPTVEVLAQVPESEVLAAWSGLGYYHRARNLLRAAREISQAGSFPMTYDAIRALPGVGAYTAAAVSSIAFGLPHAVLDGNVLRVVSRVTADSGEIAAPATRKRFQAAVDKWLDPNDPGTFNQAIMELGATVCLPRNPLCLVCPVATLCLARAVGTVSSYPVKAAKAAAVARHADLLLMETQDSVLLRQRPATASLMAGFWELPETGDFPEQLERSLVGSFTHTIVNTRWTFQVWEATNPAQTGTAAGMVWRPKGNFDGLPVTTVTRKALALRTQAP